MNFKVIETLPKFPDVLLHRDRDDNGNEVVEIVAFGFTEGVEDYHVSETIIFQEPESAQRFISDYSDFSANKWCETQNVYYSEQDYNDNN